MGNHSLNIRYARGIDLVGYLEQLGHIAQRIKGMDYWYLSPLRDEKTPSFKVNRKLNLWYDHGIGEGGTIVDFGIRYFNCSIEEFQQKIPIHEMFNQPQYRHFENNIKRRDVKSKITVLEHRDLLSKDLIGYLIKRGIALNVAGAYCREIDFLLYEKMHTAIGFANSAGGYELRNKYFKGSSAPKDVSFLNNGGEKLIVFEGFFDFLSFQTLKQYRPEALINFIGKNVNFLILNSLSFFKKYQWKMEQHTQIHLFLDRDKAGLRCSEQALKSSNLYINQSFRHRGFKDLNDLLIQNPAPEKKEKIRIKKHPF